MVPLTCSFWQDGEGSDCLSGLYVVIFSDCNEENCLEWNPNFTSTWPDSPPSCTTGVTEEMNVPPEYLRILCLDFFLPLSFEHPLSEPSARCGIKLAWASNLTGCDCVT